MSKRSAIVLLFGLLIFGAILGVPSVHWRLIGWARGESFHRGRPTSYYKPRVRFLGKVIGAYEGEVSALRECKSEWSRTSGIEWDDESDRPKTSMPVRVQELGAARRSPLRAWRDWVLALWESRLQRNNELDFEDSSVIAVLEELAEDPDKDVRRGARLFRTMIRFGRD